MAELAEAKLSGGKLNPGGHQGYVTEDEFRLFTFTLEGLVDLASIAEARFALECKSPRLNITQGLIPDVTI